MNKILHNPARAAILRPVPAMAPTRVAGAVRQLQMVWSIDKAGRLAARWQLTGEIDTLGSDGTCRQRRHALSRRARWSQPRLMEVRHGRRA